MKDSLGDRMKNNYENISRTKLMRRTPVIMRLDGKAFHTLTRECKKPFDDKFSMAMKETARAVLEEAQGSQFAYVQSDEISILFTDYATHETQAWFDYNIQKMCSVAASIASVTFTKEFMKTGYFDCRVFNIPREEVINYFIWRQQDWQRNSVQMLARSEYSQKELQHKTVPMMHDMLKEKGIDWFALNPEKWKNGLVVTKHQSCGHKIFKDIKPEINELIYCDEEKNDEVR